MFKKLMLFIITAIMIVSLMGCKDNNENQNDDNNEGTNSEVQRIGKRGGQAKLDRIQSGEQRPNHNE